jgi:hypothetical protein
MSFNSYFNFLEAKRIVDYLYADKSIEFLRSIVEASLIKVEKQFGEEDDTATLMIEECIEGHRHYLHIWTDFTYQCSEIRKSLKYEFYVLENMLFIPWDPFKEYDIEAALLVQGIDVESEISPISEFLWEEVILKYEIYLFLNHAIFLKIEELSTNKQVSTGDFTSNKSLDESASEDGMWASPWKISSLKGN